MSDGDFDFEFPKQRRRRRRNDGGPIVTIQMPPLGWMGRCNITIDAEYDREDDPVDVLATAAAVMGAIRGARDV